MDLTIMRIIPVLVLALLSIAADGVFACEPDSTPIFGCEAAAGRKFIELCASSPMSPGGYLQYRFGSLDRAGNVKAVELEYPPNREDSLRRFTGATYTHQGLYTQSIRFTSGRHRYTVFTRTRGQRDEGAGVEVKDLQSGKLMVVACSERPRFYLFELKGLLACDEDTPVGRACIR